MLFRSFSFVDMHDLTDPVNAAFGVSGLAVPNAPAQPLDLLDDHCLRLHPARVVGQQTACRLRRVLDAHRDVEPIKNGWRRDPGIDQDRPQTGTAISEGGHQGGVGSANHSEVSADYTSGRKSRLVWGFPNRRNSDSLGTEVPGRGHGMVKAIAITRLDRSAAELRDLAVRTEDSDVVRRLLAIALLLDGWPRGETATANGMDRQTLCDWVHRYNAAGVAGLTTSPRCGRPPALNEAQMAELKEMIIQGPDPETDGVVRWRYIDLRGRITEHFSVTFHPRSVARLLHKLGMTRL